MTIEFHKSRVKTIRQGDSGFTLKDGIITHPRAMLHIDPNCPFQMRNAIESAYQLGLLKCVANVYNTEYLRDVLSEDT